MTLVIGVSFLSVAHFAQAQSSSGYEQQIREARQKEAKNYLGSLLRAEQVHRLENGTFGRIQDLGIQVASEYYDFKQPTKPTEWGVVLVATAKPQYTNVINDYAGAIRWTPDGQINVIMCESLNPESPAVASPGSKNELPKCVQGRKIDI